MKFEVGDRFSKKAGAGFIGESLPLCLIPDLEGNRHPEPCMLCETEGCREYATCWVLDPDGNPGRIVLYHVSECEMLPIR